MSTKQTSMNGKYLTYNKAEGVYKIMIKKYRKSTLVFQLPYLCSTTLQLLFYF